MISTLQLMFLRLSRMAGLAIFILMPLFITACAVEHVHYGPPVRATFYPHPYDYYYYPTARVYFHFTTGYYYYRDHNRWYRSRKLPPRIYIDPRERVRVQIKGPKPYLRQPQIEKRYAPRQNYRVEEKRSIQEREANRKWYREYDKRHPKTVKQWPPSHLSKDKKYIR